MNKHADLFENIAPIVCNKPVGISHTECLHTFGAQNPLCHDYGKCRLHEKTCDQFEYVLHPRTQDSFLRACPGSGKTEVVGMKAAYLIRQWDQAHAGIAVLTFTNNAADVILERVNQFAGYLGYPHFIGTFDSWLHGYLANPFAHTVTGYAGKDGDRRICVVDVSSREDWLNTYRCKTPFVTIKGKNSKGKSGNDGMDALLQMSIFANNFWYDFEKKKFLIRSPFGDWQDPIEHEAYYNSPEFQKYLASNKYISLPNLKEELINCKKSFWKAGFVNFQDIECLSFKLLAENQTIRLLFSERFPVILVDECQDLSLGQLKILGLLQKQGSRIHLVGDINQAIYAFKKVNPENIVNFVGKGNFFKLQLLDNFRSLQPIVDLCARLVDQGDVTGVVNNEVEPTCIYFVYEPDKMSCIAVQFETYLKSRSISIKESAVLARGHTTVNKLQTAASKMPNNDSIKLATALHLWSSGGIQEMDDALKCIGYFITAKYFSGQASDSRHHYCPETEESAMKWRLFLARVLDNCINNDAISNLEQTWNNWAKTVKENFKNIVSDTYHGKLPGDSKTFSFKAPNNKSSITVISSLETAANDRCGSYLRITTIHQAKGETFEAVLVVSSPTAKGAGGHWRQWLDKTGGDGEHSRFAYVASSRPRGLLAWAVPKADESSFKELENLGFVRGELPP